jgi:hypothetical protein
LPLEKVVGEALNAEVVLQKDEVVSQVPLVAAEAPLLSHHSVVCALALLAASDKNRHELINNDFFIIVGLDDCGRFQCLHFSKVAADKFS